MEVFETLDDVFYYISDYFFSIISGFRDFFFGFDALDSNAIPYIRFFFLTVPIIFAAFEALFDWILPTLFGLQPIGFRRFFIMKSDTLKPFKAEVYKPIKVDTVRPFRFARYRKLDLSPADQKKFQLLYQQKYNCTATPMQLNKFVISEMKRYNYIGSNTGLSQKPVVRTSEGLKSFISDSLDNFRNIIKGLQDWAIRRRSAAEEGVIRTQTTAEGDSFDKGEGQPVIHVSDN